ncbi:ribosomal protein L13 [Blastocystis sp. ATCC 50177/Nand II]|uniref:Ribosomal protein L13 n=1 Tax=Blastocystis sp. subtype 1 (strain ATCC 50177 / NandII) TaxID=478820 RepID=A0A196S8B7_BLAHN|nr:ribosomal protein L13 [Blastocystis sp. ATCC 50177/Nand II]
MKHNNVLPNAHFKKDWDKRVKTCGKAEEATQFQGVFMPVEKVAPKVEFMAVSEEMKKHNAFMGLRQARCDARNFGKRAKRAAEKAAEAQE